jgi:homoserine O-acetyltransferase/O-succinyltransferase
MPSFAFDLRLPAFTLEAGARLRSHVVRGVCASPCKSDRERIEQVAHLVPETWLEAPAQVVRRSHDALEQISAKSDKVTLESSVPTVVVVHALTGDARVLGTQGFWAPLGRSQDPAEGKSQSAPLDASRMRVLCFNLIGSCYGSSGPCDAGFPRREDDDPSGYNNLASNSKGDFTIPEGRLPATVTTLDQAKSILAALDVLGIDDVALLTGGSLGGMVALVLAALAPGRFRMVVPIAATHRASPWLQAWNHIARAAIVADRERGFEIARQLGMLSYRAEPGFERTQQNQAPLPVRQTMKVQTWLEYQGTKLRARFDVEAYLCLLGAMDRHDLDRLQNAWEALTQTRVLGVAIATDQLYTPAQTEHFVRELQARGGHAERDTIVSDFGHDAFLIEWDEVRRVLLRTRIESVPSTGTYASKRKESGDQQ